MSNSDSGFSVNIHYTMIMTEVILGRIKYLFYSNTFKKVREMKKVLVFVLPLVMFASAVLAADFAPTVLKLSASQYVLYNFDSTTLEIPVTVTGTPAAVYFLVFTKDNGTTINRVRNGYLGWHYVNQIDTCLYLSPMSQFDRGANKIKWNGKDESGNAVPKGDYTYYLFGFDNADSRVQMTKHMNMFAHGAPTIITHDTSGKPLANPILYSNVPNNNASAEPSESLTKK